MLEEPIFLDRSDAGRQLAEAIIRDGAPPDPIVLALPRGGTPVAYKIAIRLQAPLDLLFVRKIGAPGHPEYGIGAVIDGNEPQAVMNDQMVSYSGATSDYVESEIKRQLAEIERRRKVYAGNRKPLDLKARNIILVDDGIATGGTVRASLRGLEKIGVESVLLAVPVAPRDVLADMRQQVDGVTSLYSPERFGSVGSFYSDFEQTTDEEVVRLLEAAQARLDKTARR